MTHKERILAAARKKPVDKLPFGARIEYWYNYHLEHDSLPEKYRGLSIIDILRDLGAGANFRLGAAWKTEYHGVELIKHEDFPRTITEYITPVGTVTLTTVFDPNEGHHRGYELELPFKSEADYPVIEYLIENTTLVPDFSQYHKATQVVGEDGLVVTGVGIYSPMQQIILNIMGYEQFFYELHDHPDKVEHLYELEKELVKQKLQILADSPVEICVLCGNWTDSIHTPIFRKYFTPWLKEATGFLHRKNKLTQVHVDGEMRRLIPLFLETGVDIAEAWCPAPMTSVTTTEARKTWGDRVTIWGGIPGILFEPQYTDEEFEQYVLNLFREVAPGYNFIVGLGDNLPVNGKIERVGKVAELIEKYGKVPIEA